VLLRGIVFSDEDTQGEAGAQGTALKQSAEKRQQVRDTMGGIIGTLVRWRSLVRCE
jgi:hypothetical protein